ncbi:MAG: AAA family ATPase [Candidatus Lokiarchaeota archaeon]|nr:AAA family ATPase [Candidatus Lokiarchaeota archaeon]
MLIIKVEIKDIFSYDHMVFNFAENDHVFIYGNNGCGKTSLFESISWCLFDNTVKGYSKDKVLRVGKTNGYVELEFLLNKHVYIVRRTRGKVNKLFVTIDGVVKCDEKSRVSDVEGILHSALKFDFDTFVNIAYSGQESVNFFNRSPKEKIENISKIFGFNKIDKAYKYVDDLLVDVGREYYELKGRLNAEKEILDRYGDFPIRQTKNDINSVKNDIKDLVNLKKKMLKLIQQNFNKKKLLKEYSYNNGKIFTLKKHYKDGANYLKKIKKEKVKLDGIINSFDIAILDVDLDELSNSRKSYAMKLSRVNDDIHEFAYTIKSYSKEVRSLEKVCVIGSKCPTCLGTVDDDRKKAIGKRIADLNTLIEDAKVKHSKLISRHVRLENSIGKVDEKLLELKRLNEKRSRIEELEKEIKIVKNRNNKHKNKIVSLSKRQKLIKGEIGGNPDANIEMFNNLILESESVAEKLSVKKVELNNLKYRLKEIKFVKKTIMEIATEVEDYFDEIQFYEFWKEAFAYKGIKLLMINRVLNQMELLANEFLINIDSNMRVVIEEGCNVSIKDGGGGVRDFNTYSLGEKKRILLALFLALNKLAFLYADIKIDFIIFDELFDGIDNVSTEKVFNAVGDFFADRSQFIIASHRKVPSGFVNRKMLFEKVNGVTNCYEE